MSDIAIRVEGLGKSYQIRHQRSGYRTLRDDLVNLLPGRRQGGESKEIFWALRDVNFEVKTGEVLGVIGRNGAGKSTLLKILARITKPSTGYADIFGRVGSLLEVGTGFHPELTGRENIFLSGTILGMRRHEILTKFDEIVDFAEVEQFLDTPVKRFSSGMYTRLAFSVAAHLDPEILIVDEVLAVGDAAFQKKSLGKMGDVALSGRTVLFVSHNMGAVRLLCPTALWLKQGQVHAFGNSDGIVQQYMSDSLENGASVIFEPSTHARAWFSFVRLLNEAKIISSEISIGTEPIVEIGFVVGTPLSGVHVACILSDSMGTHIFSTADTDMTPERFGLRSAGEYKVQVHLPISKLNAGIYQMAVGIGIPGVEAFDRRDALTFEIVDTGSYATMKESRGRAGLMLVQASWKYLE